MVDWCDLPRELLQFISNRLDSSFDLLRFRSVCASWRSSVPSRPRNSPSRFPVLPNDGISEAAGGFFLCKRTIFRLGLPYPHRHESPKSWIIKVEQVAPHRMQLFSPLSGAKLKPLPAVFPKTLDLSSVHISELGHEYVLNYVNPHPIANALGDADILYMEKVVLAPNPDGSFTILTIHVSGKLAVLGSGERNWSVIDDLPSPYDDVIYFEGRFYAVDNTGRIVIVETEPSPRVSLIAGAVFGGDKKCLVESEGKLLLVDIYLSVGPLNDPIGDDDGPEDLPEEFTYIMSERTVRFKVYMLGSRGWVEVKNLGDRILFLGDSCAFQAPASDFSGCKGNCIFFNDNCLNMGREEETPFKRSLISVFSLDSGNFYSLADSQGYPDLFSPPPAWATSVSLDDI